MSNITTDVNSFENINYPRNIYELLLSLKQQPIEINCNSQNSETQFENIYSPNEKQIGIFEFLNTSSILVSKPLYRKLIPFSIPATHFESTFLIQHDCSVQQYTKSDILLNGNMIRVLPLSSLPMSRDTSVDTPFSLNSEFVECTENQIFFGSITNDNGQIIPCILVLEYTKTTDSETPII